MASDPQWFQIDLGANQTIGRAIIRWEAAYGKSYKIQLSTNGTIWSDAYTTTTGAGGVENIAFTPASARYLRINATARGTTWAYSIYDIELYSN